MAPPRVASSFFAAVAVTFFAAAASGQGLYIDQAPASVFDGNVVRFDLDLFGGAAVADVYLPAGFTLVAVADNNFATIVDSAYLNASCSYGATGFVCAEDFALPSGNHMRVEAGTHPVSGVTMQRVLFESSFMLPGIFYVYVRLSLPACDDLPILRMGDDWLITNSYPYDPAGDGLDLCASPEVPSGLRFVPVPPSLTTAARLGARVTLALEALTSTGPRPLNEAVFDSAVFARLLQCRRAAPAGGEVFGDCTDSALAAFASVVATGEAPVTIEIAAVNAAAPAPGDLELLASLDTTPVISGAAVVTVEQAVIDGGLVLAARDAEGQLHQAAPTLEISAPGRFELEVLEAQNAHGGFEPRQATFELLSVEPVAYQDLAGAWFRASETPPALVIDALPPAPLTLTLRATHANPDGTSTSALFAVAVASEPITRTCALVLSRDQVSAGETATLRVQASDGQDLSGLEVTWSLLEGGGELTSSALEATYTAPVEPTVATIRAALVGTLCAEHELVSSISVARDLHLGFAFAKTSVEAGSLAPARVFVTHDVATAVEDLVLRVTPAKGLALADRLPRASAGVSALTAAGRGSYAFALDAAPRHELDLAFLAQHGFACGETRVAVSLYRGASATPLATANGSIEVECEPELLEATVFGRVFADEDEDGVQDEDEPGIAGALVASAAGVYATTDRHGDYHLPRLRAGRHSIKLDLGSLPPGSETQLARREVTLTPGAFVRVSYPVRLASLALKAPLALAKARGGLRVQGGVLVYRLHLEGGVAGELSATRQDGMLVSALAPGVLELPVGGEHARWLLVLTATEGRVWLFEVTLEVYDVPGASRMVVPAGPRLLGALQLPRAEGGSLVVTGELEEGVALLVEASARSRCELTAMARRVSCELFIDEGTQALGVVIASADGGESLGASLPLSPPGARHFMVGRLAATLEGAGGEGEPRGDGGGAFFYRGRLANGLELTAGADLPARELLLDEHGAWRSFGSVSSKLLGHDPRRVFSSLDEERYYPTYGDDSVSVDERESGGRFFARAKLGESFVKWGGINTAIDDAEYGQYVRSLYGLGGQVKVASEGLGLELRASGFAAQPGTQAVRDELLVTGGSFYFLSHRDVVEGSLRVVLETLDEVSGLPASTRALVEGIDYEADYLGGHLSLDAAHAQSTSVGSLSAATLGVTNRRLLVDYEYYPGLGLGEAVSAGSRAVLRYGPLSVGGTVVGEAPGGMSSSLGDLSYRLLAATARLELGTALHLRAEWAQSEGESHLAHSSLDGGLTHTALAREAVDVHGEAVALEGRGELGIIEATAYGRLVGEGFRDSRTAAGRELKQAGGRLALTPHPRTRLFVEGDHRELASAQDFEATRELLLAGGRQGFSIFDLGLEGRYEEQSEAPKLYALGAELGARVGKDWRVFARRAQKLSGESRAQREGSATTLGAAYTPGAASWRGSLELGLTDRERAFGRVQGSVPLVDGTELYTAFVARSQKPDPFDPLAPRGDSLIVGGRRRLADASLLFSEQQLTVDGAERRLVRQVGAETLIGRRVGLVFGYERGVLYDEKLAPTAAVRDAGRLGVVMPGARHTLRLGLDGRHDDDDGQRLAQLGARGRLDWRMSDALTIAMGGRGASTYGIVDSDFVTGRQVWQASAGFALRPPRLERLSSFGRYALSRERSEATASSPRTVELTHIGALAVVWNAVAALDLGPKIYARATEVRRDEEELVSRAMIAALRGDWHLPSGLDAGVEGRMCRVLSPHEAPSYGGLVEASALLLTWFRLGAGYNMSTIAADSVRCDEPGAQGFFVRGEAVY